MLQMKWWVSAEETTQHVEAEEKLPHPRQPPLLCSITSSCLFTSHLSVHSWLQVSPVWHNQLCSTWAFWGSTSAPGSQEFIILIRNVMGLSTSLLPACRRTYGHQAMLILISFWQQCCKTRMSPVLRMKIWILRLSHCCSSLLMMPQGLTLHTSTSLSVRKPWAFLPFLRAHSWEARAALFTKLRGSTDRAGGWGTVDTCSGWTGLNILTLPGLWKAKQ